MPDDEHERSCQVCGKGVDDVAVLVVNADESVRICDSCVALAAAVVEQETRGRLQ